MSLYYENWNGTLVEVKLICGVNALASKLNFDGCCCCCRPAWFCWNRPPPLPLVEPNNDGTVLFIPNRLPTLVDAVEDDCCGVLSIKLGPVALVVLAAPPVFNPPDAAFDEGVVGDMNVDWNNDPVPGWDGVVMALVLLGEKPPIASVLGRFWGANKLDVPDLRIFQMCFEK